MIHPINEMPQHNSTVGSSSHAKSAFIPPQVLRGTSHQQTQPHFPASPAGQQERQCTLSGVRGASINTKKSNVQSLQQNVRYE